MSNRRLPPFYIPNAIQCRACTDIPNITRRRKLGAYWFRVVHVKSRIYPLHFKEVKNMLVSVVHARRKERDLIFPLQIEEEVACILVLVCPCVEHDQIFPIQFEEVGNMFDLDCPFIQSMAVSKLFCISAEVQ